MITYHFGASSQIERLARKLLPPDDPLQASAFFPNFADAVRGVTSPSQFDHGFHGAKDDLPVELKDTFPAGFERKLLETLCHDNRFLIAYAQDTGDFMMLSKWPSQLPRLVLWPPFLWPLNLVFYSCLALAFGGAMALQLGVSDFILVRIFAGVVIVEFMGIMIWVCATFTGEFGAAALMVIGAIVDSIMAVSQPDGPRRLKEIARLKTRREKRELQKERDRRRAQSDPHGYLKGSLIGGLVGGLLAASPLLLLQLVLIQLRLGVNGPVLLISTSLIITFAIGVTLYSAYTHRLPLVRLLR